MSVTDCVGCEDLARYTQERLPLVLEEWEVWSHLALALLLVLVKVVLIFSGISSAENPCPISITCLVRKLQLLTQGSHPEWG